jgi:diacylglycerol kinase (ATP)
VSSPLGTPLLIVNPVAGNGRDGVLARLRRGLDQAGIAHDVVLTGHRGHASMLARDAVTTQGYRFVVSVGGDGTLHEVVNGLVDAERGRLRGDDPVLGVVGAGSGSDFTRTFGLDRAPERLIQHLGGDTRMRIDLGRVRFHRAGGGSGCAVFANVAEVGFGARVAATAARLPRFLGSGRYVVGIALAWVAFRRVETSVAVDGGSRTEPLCNVVVANAQFYGGGLHVAPRAIPSDGRLDVQSWGGSPTDVVRAARQLRRGTHLGRADVRSWSTTTARVDAARTLPVEADGEVLGHTPAEFDVLAGILSLKI